MDGANLNAILGRFKPGEAGFDVMHFNTHKTFSTPHGGGGPGAGPVGVSDAPRAVPARAARPARGRRRVPARAPTASARPRSAGCARSSAARGVLVRAYAYMRAHGAAGLREVSDDAVLAANYLKARVGEAYEIPFDRACKHEFVASAADLKQRDRRAHARRRQAADRQGLPPADDLLPADGRGGHADRAHRDRVARDARRASPTR